MSVNYISIFASEEATGIASLGINVKALLLQAGTFLILYLLFKKFAMAKVVKALADRREKIDEGLANADLMEKRIAELKVTTEEKLAEARAESEAVIARAHEESGKLIAQAEAAAAKRAESMIDDARKTMEADIEKVRRELRKEMLNLVTAATESVLDEKIDDKKDAKLIERAIAGANVE